MLAAPANPGEGVTRPARSGRTGARTRASCHGAFGIDTLLCAPKRRRTCLVERPFLGRLGRGSKRPDIEPMAEKERSKEQLPAAGKAAEVEAFLNRVKATQAVEPASGEAGSYSRSMPPQPRGHLGSAARIERAIGAAAELGDLAKGATSRFVTTLVEDEDWSARETELAGEPAQLVYVFFHRIADKDNRIDLRQLRELLGAVAAYAAGGDRRSSIAASVPAARRSFWQATISSKK